jgi:hypothetical protein
MYVRAGERSATLYEVDQKEFFSCYDTGMGVFMNESIVFTSTYKYL